MHGGMIVNRRENSSAINSRLLTASPKWRAHTIVLKHGNVTAIETYRDQSQTTGTVIVSFVCIVMVATRRGEVPEKGCLEASGGAGISRLPPQKCARSSRMSEQQKGKACRNGLYVSLLHSLRCTTYPLRVLVHVLRSISRSLLVGALTDTQADPRPAPAPPQGGAPSTPVPLHCLHGRAPVPWHRLHLHVCCGRKGFGGRAQLCRSPEPGLLPAARRRGC